MELWLIILCCFGYLLFGGILGYVVSKQDPWDGDLFPVVWSMLFWPILTLVFGPALLIRFCGDKIVKLIK